MMDDEDGGRVALAEAGALRAVLKKLADLCWAPNHPHRSFVRKMLMIDLAGISEWERYQVTLLAWAFRAELPPHLRPKINPHDPLSPDRARMEAAASVPGGRLPA